MSQLSRVPDRDRCILPGHYRRHRPLHRLGSGRRYTDWEVVTEWAAATVGLVSMLDALA